MSVPKCHPLELLGKNVEVRLGEEVVVKGKLLSYGTDGTVIIVQEADGEMMFCWPMLEVTECT